MKTRVLVTDDQADICKLVCAMASQVKPMVVLTDTLMPTEDSDQPKTEPS
jgi:hypothetical protein